MTRQRLPDPVEQMVGAGSRTPEPETWNIDALEHADELRAIAALSAG